MITPWIAALIIGGFFAGATVATVGTDGGFRHHEDVSISASASSHEDACSARYRSYDVDRDMYMGNDGNWHSCRL